MVTDPLIISTALVDTNSGSLSRPSNPPLETTNFAIDVVTGLALTRSSSLPDIINSLDEVEGTLTLTNGSLITDLVTPFGPSQETFNLVTLATNLNETFQGSSGTLNLSGGLASGNLVVDDEEFTATNFEFASLIGGFVTDFLTTIDGTVPFANGQIAIDLPTPFGDVKGTVGFGSGALAVNLDTPFAPLNFSIDFPDDAQFAFPIPQFGSTGILNLATGRIEVDLIPALSGPELAIPINALAGNVTFTNGIAALSIESGLGVVNTQFNFAAEVGETLTEFLSTATGTLTVGNGNLGANLQTDLGVFSGVLPASQLLSDFIATLPQYQGTVTLAGGSATVNLTTPDGPVQGSLNYGQYLDGTASIVRSLTAV